MDIRSRDTSFARNRSLGEAIFNLGSPEKVVAIGLIVSKTVLVVQVLGFSLNCNHSTVGRQFAMGSAAEFLHRESS